MNQISRKVKVIATIIGLAIAVPLASACELMFVQWMEGSIWQSGECSEDILNGYCYGTCRKTQVVTPVCMEAAQGIPCPPAQWNEGPHAMCESYGWEGPGHSANCECHADDP